MHTHRRLWGSQGREGGYYLQIIITNILYIAWSSLFVGE